MRASSVLRQFAVPKFIALALTAAVLMVAGCNVEVVGPNEPGPTTYTLTTTASPAAGGTVSRNPNTMTHNAGARVTVTASPATGYKFVGWSGASTSTNTSVTITMDRNQTLTANFELETGPTPTHTVTTSVAPAAAGSVTLNPSRTSYAAGTQVTATAVPASGYAFDYWTVTGGTIADIDDEVTQITVNANITMTANFRAVTVAGTPDMRWYTSDTMAQTYTISTADELAGLARLVNEGNTFSGRTIVLGDDVDLSSYGQQNASFNSGRGWIPIGQLVSSSVAHQFGGTLDGNGKTISGLYINSTVQRIGLFGRVNGGTVKDLALVDVEVVGGEYTGGLAGYVTDGTVENCYVTGTVRGVGNVGGLVGYLGGSTATVRNCYSEARVNGAGSVGGLIGTNIAGATVTNSYATGTVSGNGGSIGGLVGDLGSATVANCYATGAVSGNTNVGGLVGYGNVNGIFISIVNSVALNPDIESTVSGAGRILGGARNINSTGVINGNAAFDGITRDQSAHEWAVNVRHNGDDLTIEEIVDGDGTIGNRFRASNGWTVEPGKLPGLMGRTVDLPAHLR